MPDSGKSFEPSSDYAETPLSLGRLTRILRRRAVGIIITLAVIGLFIVIGAILYLLTRESQRIVTLPFRLEFQGAERGLYPNGTRFSSSELVATPILTRVHEANGLERFVSFKEFNESIYVVEANRALEQLSREYSAKLSDPRLGAVDRDRLEGEFRQKRDSLARNQFALSYFSDSDALPRPLIAKSLNDVLVIWAESATKEKGVLRYQIPVLSKAILAREALSSEDAVIALDVLRTRIESIVRNIEDLERVPGAIVLRAGPNELTLTEIRFALADTVRFQVQPLLARLRSANASPDPAATLEFLESQLAYNRRQADAARARAESLKETLQIYAQQQPGAVDAYRAGVTGGRSDGSGETVMPQLSETFLDRLIDLTRQQQDVEYRQDLVDRINDASLHILPYEEEVAYYDALLSRMRGLGSSGATSTAMVRAELVRIVQNIQSSIEHINAIYERISQNMNPSTVLYTITGPPTARIERPVSYARVALGSLLVFLVSIPIVILTVLLWERVREEEAVDEAAEEADDRAAVSRTIDEPSLTRR